MLNGFTHILPQLFSSTRPITHWPTANSATLKTGELLTKSINNQCYNHSETRYNKTCLFYEMYCMIYNLIMDKWHIMHCAWMAWAESMMKYKWSIYKCNDSKITFTCKIKSKNLPPKGRILHFLFLIELWQKLRCPLIPMTIIWQSCDRRTRTHNYSMQALLSTEDLCIYTLN